MLFFCPVIFSFLYSLTFYFFNIFGNLIIVFQGLLDDGKKASKSHDEMSKQDANFNNMENGFVANKDEDHLVVRKTFIFNISMIF